MTSIRLTLLFILAVGALVRVLAVVPPVVDGDESWVGMAAVNVLAGVFPFFFYSQPYMGGVEAFLQAPVIAAFGPARWSLKILPVMLGVLFVYLSYRLASRLFDRQTACLAALAAACPASTVVKWAVSARLHYSLTPLLGALLILVAVGILRRRDTRAPAAWLTLGLVSGLIWWTNHVGVVYLGAVGCVLAATRFRSVVSEGLRYALPGLLLGSLPMWVYNLQTGRLFVPPRGTWAAASELLPNVTGFLGGAVPDLLGVPDTTLTVARFGAVAVVGGLWVAGLAHLCARAWRGDAASAVAPLVFVNLAVLVTASVYGKGEPGVFPLFAVIPLIMGAGLGVIARRVPVLGWALAALLAGTNVATALDERSGVFHPERLQAFRAEVAAEQELFRTLRARQLLHVYSEDYGALNFLSGGSLVFARTLGEEAYPRFAELADGALRGAYVSRERSERLEAGLAALSARYEVQRIPPWWLYHGFSLPQRRYEEISPEGWTATAEENPHRVALAFDRDIGTSWKGRATQRPGSTYVLDLGRVHPLEMVAWIPWTHGQSPRGIEFHTSLDGVTWQLIRRVSPYHRPVYWSGTHPFLRLRRPRVELRFPATAARFIRLTQLGEDAVFGWSMRELFVYRPADSPREPDPAQLDGIVPLLRGRGVTRVYGDHWVLSRLRVVSGGTLPTLPVSTYVDNYGRTDLHSRWEHPPDYEKLDRLVLSPGAAVVLEGWMGTHQAFERIVRDAGYAFERERFGDYLVYSQFIAAPLPTGPLPRTGWRASASAEGEPAQHAIDGVRATRWTTVGVMLQTPGMWFTVDLGVPTAIGAIALDVRGSVRDYPRGLALAVSADGANWEAVSPSITALGPLYWSGTHALRDGVRGVVLRFPARTARLIRLEQTGRDPAYGWSIHELEVYPPGR